VFHSSFEEGRGGTTILVSKKINVIYSDTKIPGTVLLVLQKGKATIILGGIYLSQRVDKTQKLSLILETVDKLWIRYDNPAVLLFGDLNMNERTVSDFLEKQGHLVAKLGLHIVNAYTSPINFPPLSTRKGTNKHNLPVYSRLDYIITNGNCITVTEFVENLSDHIFFNTKLRLRQSNVRRVLSTDRNKIFREIKSLKEEGIASILNYIKDNLHTYKKSRAPKPPTQDPLTFQISCHQQRLLSEWIKDYAIFARSASQLRFSSFQGLAFRTIRSITKYDQFYKRDGSIIKVIKDEEDRIITDPSLVCKSLIDHLRQDDNRFQDRTYTKWDHIPSMPKLSEQELLEILAKCPYLHTPPPPPPPHPLSFLFLFFFFIINY